MVNVFFSFEKEFIRKNIVQRNLITKINRVIRMVLRGLDDVSEIVMRAGAGEGAASTSQAVLSHLARPSLLAPGIQRIQRPGVGESGSDGCRRPALQSHQLQLKLQCRASGLQQPDCLQHTAGGGAKAAVGGASETETSGNVRDSELWDSYPGTL